MIGGDRSDRAGEPVRIRFGGIWIDALTFGGALDAIGRLVDGGAGGAVFTPNVDHVVNAESNDAFREAYARASLSLVDGQALVWASRFLGAPLPEKISGSDLVEPLMERAGRRGWRVFLVGGAPGSAQAAAERFRRDCGAQIVGVEDGRVGLETGPADEALLARIAEARPQLLLVALGSPKQELWIDARRARLAPAVSIAVGVALDFLSGAVRRGGGGARGWSGSSGCCTSRSGSPAGICGTTRSSSRSSCAPGPRPARPAGSLRSR